MADTRPSVLSLQKPRSSSKGTERPNPSVTANDANQQLEPIRSFGIAELLYAIIQIISSAIIINFTPIPFRLQNLETGSQGSTFQVSFSLYLLRLYLHRK